MYSVDNYAFPSVVLDREGKIIAKNKASSICCPFFRKGSSLKSLLTPLEIGAMFSLKAGESITVKLKNDISAIIFYDGESYMLRTNILGVNLCKDISYVCDIREKGLRYFEFPSNIYNKNILRHSLYIQKCMNEYIKFIMEPSSVPHRMVDVSLILRNIIKACTEKLKSTRLSVIPENIESSCFIVSSQSHTEYIVLMAFALLFYLSEKTQISVNMFSSYGRVCLSFKSYAQNKSTLLDNVMKIINKNGNCDDENEIYFYAIYIKTIIELHGGNVYIEHTPISGEIELRMSFPMIKDDTLTFECDKKICTAYSELFESILYTLVEPFCLEGDRDECKK